MSDTFFGRLPTARKLEGPDRPKGYAGTIEVLRDATPELIEVARRHFPETTRDDFEVDGREWTDIGTGDRYRIALFDPLASSDPKASRVSAFLVDGPKLVFLYRMGVEEESHRVVLGEIGVRTLTGQQPLGSLGPRVY
jgi:hypothetical protein